MPRRWHQVGGSVSAGDGGKKARSPGRARRKPLKPLRGECRAFSGVTVVTNARVYYTPRAAAGASGARDSLRPRIGEGGSFTAKLARSTRRDREFVSRRHCERKRSNPLFASPILDCFAEPSSGGALRRSIGSQ